MRTYDHSWEDGTNVNITVHDPEPPRDPIEIMSHIGGWTAPNVKNIRSIGKKNIIGDNGKPDWAKLHSALPSIFPDDYDWFGLIDLEVLSTLGIPKSPLTITDLRNVALMCRAWRPLIKWGWYSIPTRSYWDQSETWYNNNLGLRGITELLSFVVPSCYDFYKASSLDDERFGDIVKLAVEMALPNQKVAAYTAARYHHSVHPYGYELIPRSEHVSHMRNLIVNGAQALVVWNGDWFTAHYCTEKNSDGSWKNTDTAHQKARQVFSTELGTPEATLDKIIIQQYLTQTLFPEIMDRMNEAANS